MTQAATISAPRSGEVLNLAGLTKRYPGVTALDDVSLSFDAGTIHALVGENGAGKSTLIKLITGAIQPNEGRITLFGADHTGASTRERRSLGVAAIYQELLIVPMMSAAENVFLDAPPRRAMRIDRRAMNGQFEDLAARLGVRIDPGAPAGALSIADRQMIEIMRALRTDCHVLILDEPTATLGPSERQKLFEVMRDLRARGTALVYISHDLDEVMDLSDHISVMRNGRLVRSEPSAEWTKSRMVSEMVGDKNLEPSPSMELAGGAEAAVALRLSEVTVPGVVENLDLDLREGEILGLAGLVGAGRSEILRAIAGVDPGARGRMEIAGVSRELPLTIREAGRAGIAFVPEDRKDEGIVPLLPGRVNVGLTDLRQISRGGVVDRRKEAGLAQEASKPLGFDPARLGHPIGTLSGGNQQKLVIAKWLHRRPRILLLDEPTRGVDIGARAEIYRSIRALAGQGLAVLLVSSDLEEITEHADRVLVLAGGRIRARLSRDEATAERILSHIFLSDEAPDGC